MDFVDDLADGMREPLVSPIILKGDNTCHFSREFKRGLVVAMTFAAVVLVVLLKSNLLVTVLSPRLQSRNTSYENDGEHAKPNIIFILADDLGYNSLSEQITPFLSKLKSAGVSLSNYYTQEMCTPSRAAFLTGRYPIRYGWQYGIVNFLQDAGLSVNETTIAEVLKYHGGYSTHLVGKWHLGHASPRYLPTARGFDYSLGYLGGVEYYWSKRLIGEKLEKFHDFMYSDKECYYGYNGDDAQQYSTHLYQDIATTIIEGHHYTESPLFLYMAFQAVHIPFVDANGTFASGIPKDYVSEEVYSFIYESFPSKSVRQYYLALNVLDSAVQRIVTAVESAGQMDNTYFIFASDNGGCASGGGRNYPLRGQKGTLWEGGTRVEAFIYSKLMVVAIPSTLDKEKEQEEKAIRSYDGLFHVTDWFPTILRMAGVNYTATLGFELDGVDQFDYLLKRARSIITTSVDDYPRKLMLYNYYHTTDGLDFWNNGGGAIRNARYKLMHAYNASWYPPPTNRDDDKNSSGCTQDAAMVGPIGHYLFDLLEDPLERYNLYNTSDEYKAIQDALYAEISRYDRYTYTASGANKSLEAPTVWAVNGSGYVTPWIAVKEEDTIHFNHKVARSFPNYCGLYDNTTGSSSSIGTNIDDMDDVMDANN